MGRIVVAVLVLLLTAGCSQESNEMTLEDLEGMSGKEAISLGTCQLVKYEMENGKAAMDRKMDEFVDEVAAAPSAKEVVSIQEEMIRDGYSCTRQEMKEVANTGTLSEE